MLSCHWIYAALLQICMYLCVGIWSFIAYPCITFISVCRAVVRAVLCEGRSCQHLCHELCRAGSRQHLRSPLLLAVSSPQPGNTNSFLKSLSLSESYLWKIISLPIVLKLKICWYVKFLKLSSCTVFNNIGLYV